MADDERKPWDQLPEEPDAAYKRFLGYLVLGSARSIRAAYHEHRGATRGNKQQRPPGEWTDNSVRYRWVARANAYDIAHLRDIAARVTLNTVRLLDAMAEATLEAVGNGVSPADWGDVTATARALARFVGGDAAASLADGGDTATPEAEDSPPP